MSSKEWSLALQICAFCLPEPAREYRFHDKRKWRFDFAWPDLKLAVEVEGGLYSGGRHTRGAGYEKDLEKYAAAMLLGWDVYRCSPRMISDGTAIKTIETLLKMKMVNQKTK